MWKSDLSFFQGYGSWTNWSACSKSCGNGQITASRACIDGPCSLSLTRNNGCHKDGCRYSLWKHNLTFFQGYGLWSNWSVCSKSCGTGVMAASRTCFDGPCSQSLNREMSCHVDGCRFSIIGRYYFVILVFERLWILVKLVCMLEVLWKWQNYIF